MIDVVLKSGQCVLAANTLVALSDVIDLLVAVPLGIVSAQQLEEAIDLFLRCVITAGWRMFMHPKYHWLVHMGTHLRKHKCLLTCWVHERKHRAVKRLAQDVKNTRVYEKSVISEVVCLHLAELEDADSFKFAVRLLRPRLAPKKMTKFVQDIIGLQMPIYTSADVRISPVATCSMRDVVLFKDPSDPAAFLAGEVYFHCRIGDEDDDEHASLIAHWKLINKNIKDCVAYWAQSDDHIDLIATADIFCAVCYMTLREGVIRTLLPLQMRY